NVAVEDPDVAGILRIGRDLRRAAFHQRPHSVELAILIPASPLEKVAVAQGERAEEQRQRAPVLPFGHIVAERARGHYLHPPLLPQLVPPPLHLGIHPDPPRPRAREPLAGP